MAFFVPTKFVWRFGGNQVSVQGAAGRVCAAPQERPRPSLAKSSSQVHLCGSFTRWVETVPMTPVDGQPGTFSVVVHLPPG